MKKLLQVHFDYHGPFAGEMSEAMKELAQSINQEPGFIWKIWTENRQAQEAGGIYLFEDEATASAYLKKHTERLRGFGIDKVVGHIFDVNEPLTRINHGPAQ